MELMKYLPEWYENSPETKDLLNAMETETKSRAEGQEEISDQCYVKSATWGLTLWEKMYGILPDIAKPYDFRRSRLLSKMRGVGSVTAAMLANVAASYTNGEVEVIEHNDEYYFVVDFVGTKGQPPNLDDLKAAIEEIKPAHLGVQYQFHYATHAQVGQYTHAQLAAYTHAQIRTL